MVSITLKLSLFMLNIAAIDAVMDTTKADKNKNAIENSAEKANGVSPNTKGSVQPINPNDNAEVSHDTVEELPKTDNENNKDFIPSDSVDNDEDYSDYEDYSDDESQDSDDTVIEVKQNSDLIYKSILNTFRNSTVIAENKNSETSSEHESDTSDDEELVLVEPKQGMISTIKKFVTSFYSQPKTVDVDVPGEDGNNKRMEVIVEENDLENSNDEQEQIIQPIKDRNTILDDLNDEEIVLVEPKQGMISRMKKYVTSYLYNKPKVVEIDMPSEDGNNPKVEVIIEEDALRNPEKNSIIKISNNDINAQPEENKEGADNKNINDENNNEKVNDNEDSIKKKRDEGFKRRIAELDEKFKNLLKTHQGMHDKNVIRVLPKDQAQKPQKNDDTEPKQLQNNYGHNEAAPEHENIDKAAGEIMPEKPTPKKATEPEKKNHVKPAGEIMPEKPTLKKATEPEKKNHVKFADEMVPEKPTPNNVETPALKENNNENIIEKNILKQLKPNKDAEPEIKTIPKTDNKTSANPENKTSAKPKQLQTPLNKVNNVESVKPNTVNPTSVTKKEPQLPNALPINDKIPIEKIKIEVPKEKIDSKAQPIDKNIQKDINKIQNDPNPQQQSAKTPEMNTNGVKNAAAPQPEKNTDIKNDPTDAKLQDNSNPNNTTLIEDISEKPDSTALEELRAKQNKLFELAKSNLNDNKKKNDIDAVGPEQNLQTKKIEIEAHSPDKKELITPKIQSDKKENKLPQNINDKNTPKEKPKSADINDKKSGKRSYMKIVALTLGLIVLVAASGLTYIYFTKK